ncbi:MAG: hypothetical protein DRQ98_12080 [Gammaproteobacteria bacterium]|nr:MAG: hypothetical protein DRQ98_12080 [Gammaproteobacteria bacterium]
MPEDQEMPSVGEFLLYTTEDGISRVECRLEIDPEATCKEYLQVRSEGERKVNRQIKGFTMDDERLKNPDIAGTSTVPDYFDEILSSISERNQGKLPRATIWKSQITANNGIFNNSLLAA